MHRGRITASAKADRVEVSVRDPLGTDGQPLPVSVSIDQGFAPGLYLGADAGTDHLVVADGAGRAMVLLHLGNARAYEIEYPFDLSALAPGPHVLTFVVRDGTAMQCQSQTELPLTIPERAAKPAAEPAAAPAN